MAKIYNHVQLGVADSNGDINVLYPISTGEDVSIDKTNTNLPKNAINVQDIINSIGKMAFEDGNDVVRFDAIEEGDDYEGPDCVTEINDDLISLGTTWSSKKITSLVAGENIVYYHQCNEYDGDTPMSEINDDIISAGTTWSSKRLSQWLSGENLVYLGETDDFEVEEITSEIDDTRVSEHFTWSSKKLNDTLNSYRNKKCILSDVNGVITSDYGYTYNSLSELLQSGNFEKIISNGDYILLTLADGTSFKLRFNIDTYHRYGDEGPIPHHIDLISDELIPDSRGWIYNSDHTNNGVSSDKAAYLHSEIKDNLYEFYNTKLHKGLRDHIINKRCYIPTRFDEAETLTEDNAGQFVDLGYLWIPFESEVWGSTRKASPKYEGGLRQYYTFREEPESIVKTIGTERVGYWLASAYDGTYDQMCVVNEYGVSIAAAVNNILYGVPLCFRFV